MPLVWAWEYGDRGNLTEVRERWFPLVKGVSDFFVCWLELDAVDGLMHDNHDCFAIPGGAGCAVDKKDKTETLAFVRRSLDVVSEMAAAVGELVDPRTWNLGLYGIDI